MRKCEPEHSFAAQDEAGADRSGRT